MRNYKFSFEVDDETFRNIRKVKVIVKHKNPKYTSKIPISKRMMKYKAYLEYSFKEDKPSTGV